MQTTTTVVAAASTTVNATTAGSTTAKKEKYTVSNVASIAPQMDSRVLNAFTKMGFTVIVDPSVSYAGYFDGRSRTITLPSPCSLEFIVTLKPFIVDSASFSVGKNFSRL